MTKLNDYTIEHTGLDWSQLFAAWSWLVPPRFTLWIMNRFGDPFLVLEDGSVHMLDTGAGSLEKLAESRDDFCLRIDEGENANNWLMIPLVDKLVAAGKLLEAGECYSFVLPPILGGDYTTENTQIIPVPQHFLALGHIHEKLKDLPDGPHVRFAIE